MLQIQKVKVLHLGPLKCSTLSNTTMNFKKKSAAGPPWAKSTARFFNFYLLRPKEKVKRRKFSVARPPGNGKVVGRACPFFHV